MLLNKIFENYQEIEIENLMLDSRKNCQKALFFCLKGLTNDSHSFVNQAIKNGAIAVCHSKEIEKEKGVIYIKVDDVQKALEKACSKFYNNPSKHLDLIGVSGTNGKTTTAALIKQIISLKKPCGYMGTLGIDFDKTQIIHSLTTADILTLNQNLKKMVDNNLKACALEVSSIGIDQKRIGGLDFKVGIYTNLSHDHLDYHKTMENYLSAKKSFYDNLSEKSLAIINIDDKYSDKIKKDVKAKIITYSLENKNADYFVENIKLFLDKTSFVLVNKKNRYNITTNLVAEFNIYNLLAALACVNELGYNLNEIIPHLNNLKNISGRVKTINHQNKYQIIIDYAHTPDGYLKMFEFAKKITDKNNKILVVAGSAGNRDKTKRQIIGKICEENADKIIITEEDPYDENPLDICNEVIKGIEKKEYELILNRSKAIKKAVDLMEEKDTLLILGKGEEAFMMRKNNKEEKYEGDFFFADKYLKEKENQ